jgi:hypothetical protein
MKGAGSFEFVQLLLELSTRYVVSIVTKAISGGMRVANSFYLSVSMGTVLALTPIRHAPEEPGAWDQAMQTNFRSAIPNLDRTYAAI